MTDTAHFCQLTHSCRFNMAESKCHSNREYRAKATIYSGPYIIYDCDPGRHRKAGGREIVDKGVRINLNFVRSYSFGLYNSARRHLARHFVDGAAMMLIGI